MFSESLTRIHNVPFEFALEMRSGRHVRVLRVRGSGCVPIFLLLVMEKGMGRR